MHSKKVHTPWDHGQTTLSGQVRECLESQETLQPSSNDCTNEWADQSKHQRTVSASTSAS